MTAEQAEVLGWFTHMLGASTADGGRKRAAGLKPSWKVDSSHEAAIYSHLTKWKKGEQRDADSGAHPLVHAAWRCLAIAWQETHAEAPAQEQPPVISSREDAVSHAMDVWEKKHAANRFTT